MGNICSRAELGSPNEHNRLIGSANEMQNLIVPLTTTLPEQPQERPAEPATDICDAMPVGLPRRCTEESQNSGSSTKNPSMGAHSRSSTDASDALPIALEISKSKFMKDFDFRDLSDDMTNFFTKFENDYIKTPKDSAESICVLLFGVLVTKDDSAIERFLKVVGQDHQWLQQKVENERNRVVNKIDEVERYSDMYHRLQRGLNPKFPEYNVRRCELYLKLRKILLQVKLYNRVALVGDFGFGKKWLAIDVCSDYAVAKAMNFQIFWLDMRKCTSAIQDLDKLKEFYVLLTGMQRSSSPTMCTSMEQPTDYANQIDDDIRKIIVNLTNELRKPHNRECLVVLANVENRYAVQSFNLPCKVLIITRRKKVADAFAKKNGCLSLYYGLNKPEVNLLFEKYLGNVKFNESDMESICTNSNGHPLLLSIVAQSLRQGAGWESWIQKLKESVIRDSKLKVAVEKSLQWLEESLRHVYLRVFSIFPRRIFVPYDLLRELWHKERNAKDDLNKLYDYGFLNKSEQSDGTFSYALPFIYSKYLDDTSKRERQQLQEKVLAYYNVLNDLEQRNEVKLFVRPEHDFYFFSNIGYHLSEANRLDVLTKLYFDFGFLEQKIRSLGLLHTMSDLEKYKVDLTDNNPYCCRKLHALREFLPSAEKTLLECESALLLQRALMEHNTSCIYEMATQQAAKFPNHIWFEERGFFHQSHHIYPLPGQPNAVVFLDESLCLLKTTSSMLLVNTSLDLDSEVKVLHMDDKDNEAFISMCVFHDPKSIADIKLVLYKSGDLKLWSNKFNNTRPKDAIKKIDFVDPIVAIDIEFIYKINLHRLHVATRSGKLIAFDWQSDHQEFVALNTLSLQTRMQNIRLLHVIFSTYYLVATDQEVRIWNYTDSSNERGSESIKYLIDDIELTHQKRLLICRDSILTLELNGLQIEKKLYWELNESLHRQRNVINCAKLLDDKVHMVLGTKNGLLVLNLQSKLIILATNVSENIVCIDAKALEDTIYKYIIACGVYNKPLLNLFALRVKDGALEWAHTVPYVIPETGSELLLPPAVQLVGGKLYETNYENDRVTIMAVDSKNAIHLLSEQKCMLYKEVPKAQITALAMRGEAAFVGCSNGTILNVSTQQCEYGLQAVFKGEHITYLELLDSYTLVVASRHICVIVMDWRNSGTFHKYPLDNTDVKSCFQLTPHTLLIVLSSCQFKVLDMNNGEVLTECGRVRAFFFGGCDYRNKHLFLATKSNEMQVYDLSEMFSPAGLNVGSPEKIKVYNHVLLDADKITCLTASFDASLVAIGLESGTIYVYQYDGGSALRLVHILISHHKPISDMKFSPGKLVLVSCAEQLNFWSVTEMLNNPLLPPKKKRNSRFKSDYDYDEPEEVDATAINNSSRSLCVNFTSRSSSPKNNFGSRSATPCLTSSANHSVSMLSQSSELVWMGKHGPAAKSTLLSCIKFAGAEAKKFCADSTFTRFNVVDNEGCHYALTVKSFTQLQDTRDNYDPQLLHHHNVDDEFEKPTQIEMYDDVDFV